MSIQTQIERLTGAKAALKTAIEQKGVAVPEGAPLEQYAPLVEQIVGGGSPTKWVTLLEKEVDDNSIVSYAVDVTEPYEDFLVCILFADDPDITSQINGAIAVNTNNPWNAAEKNRVSGHIQTLPHKAEGQNAKAVAVGFSITSDGYLLPSQSASSQNTTGIANVFTSNTVLVSEDGMRKLSLAKIDMPLSKISVGSYTKYFGIGSKVYIFARK